MKKLLYSPGFGAGWTTWEGNDEVRRFMASYEPLVEFIEGVGKFERGECEIVYSLSEPDVPPSLDKLHPVLREFAEECQRRFGDIPYLGGARDLQVLTVGDDERVRFEEYDGNESYVTAATEYEWL